MIWDWSYLFCLNLKGMCVYVHCKKYFSRKEAAVPAVAFGRWRVMPVVLHLHPNLFYHKALLLLFLISCCGSAAAKGHLLISVRAWRYMWLLMWLYFVRGLLNLVSRFHLTVEARKAGGIWSFLVIYYNYGNWFISNAVLMLVLIFFFFSGRAYSKNCLPMYMAWLQWSLWIMSIDWKTHKNWALRVCRLDYIYLK